MFRYKLLIIYSFDSIQICIFQRNDLHILHLLCKTLSCCPNSIYILSCQVFLSTLCHFFLIFFFERDSCWPEFTSFHFPFVSSVLVHCTWITIIGSISDTLVGSCSSRFILFSVTFCVCGLCLKTILLSD